MNEKIRNYLHFSLPQLVTLRRGWLLSFAVLSYIIMIVNYEHPFGGPIEQIPHHHRLLSGLGCVCIAIYLLFFQVFPLFFKRVFQWEFKKRHLKFINLLLFTVIMLVANVVYVVKVVPPPAIPSDYLKHIVYFTVMFNFIPVLALQANQKTNFKNSKEELSVEITETTPQQPVQTIPVDLTAMKGRIYQSEEIKYFEVYGNYQKTHFDSKTPTLPDTLTGSMKHLEELLALHPEFKRCNRSFLINTKKIQTCNGSSSFILIKLHDCDVEFKVYREQTSGFLPFLTKKSTTNSLTSP